MVTEMEIQMDKFFILYDSINGKYIKKVRYFLFNIKDRNNPELRACVV